MKLTMILIVTLLFTSCASNPIYRDCKQIGQDSNGKPLYDSCEKLK